MLNVRCTSPLRRLSSIFLASAVALSASVGAFAQSAAIAALRPVSQANRVPASPDFGPKTQLSGHLPGWVSSGAQVSKTVDTSETLHVTLVLQRDATVQAAFEKLLADQQNPSSPLYHEWLTPQQVGQLYGPTDSDVAAVTSWLSSQGLTVDLVSNSKLLIDAHASTAAVSSAFRTSFGFFELNGAARLSAVAEPSIPTALAPVVKYIYGLTEVPLRPLSIVSAPHKSDAVVSAAAGSTATPNYTTSGGNHYMAPGDFATIYDVNSVYTGGNKGATLGSGVTNHVAIIGRSRVAATDISEWATNVGLTTYNASNLNTIIPTTGTDPGATCTTSNANTCTTGGDQGEQTLDVARVMGTAPGVMADLVVSLSSRTTDGVYISAAYNVNTTADKIMTISYGSCEANNGSSGVSLWDTLFSTGVSEGISTFVSSGDSAANGCATSFTATTTTRTASINAICSSTYATCVGGTEFADTASPSTYWASYISGGNNASTALSYIPEGAWNEPEAGGTVASTDCSGGTYCPSGTGGGVSVYIAKPTWQTGTGVPADGFRDVPDVAYPAASHDGYYACLDYALGPYITAGQIPAGSNCTTGYFFSFSGTSAAAPAMAGVAALVDTAAGKALGNLNPTLYSVANGASGSTAFHDITVASSGVSGCSITIPSMCNNSTPGSSANSTTVAGGLQGYLLTNGYDQATGLGSIDVAKFIAAVITPPPSFTVTPASTSVSALAGIASTDGITLASVNSFVGAVALTCTVTAGTAMGTCSLTPTSATLASGGTGTSTLSITPTTVGTFTVTVTGTSGTTVVTSSTITVTSGAPFSLKAASASLSGVSGTASTDVITATSTAPFAGSVAFSCAVSPSTSGTCSLTPTSATVASGGTGTSTLSVTPSGIGTFTVTVTGTSGSQTATTTVSVTSVGPYTVTPASASVAAVVGTASTDGITLTSTAPFAGAVALTCAVTAGTGNGACSLTPTSATLTSGGTGTSTLSVTPSSTGTFTVTVTGTSGTSTVTSSVITVTAVAPFSLSAASASISAVATTVSTDGITVTSTAPFAGAVSFSCAVTAGTTTGTCSLTPTSATVASGGTGTSTLSVTPSGVGTFTVTVTGTNGTSTATTSVITVTSTAPFSLSPASTSLAAYGGVGKTDSIAITPVGSYAGSVALTCAVTSGTTTGACTVSPSPVAVSGGTVGTSLLTVTPTGVGTLTVTVTGTVGSITATTSVISVTSAIPFSLAAGPTSLSFTSGATTGNTSQIVLTSASGQNVGLSCSVSSSNAYYQPTCSLSQTTVNNSGQCCAVLTINSTTAVNATNKQLATAGFATNWRFGLLLLAFAALLLPFGRRCGFRALRILPLLAILGLGATMISGCGSGGNAPPVVHSSAGSYTVTVTGTNSVGSATTTVAVTIN